MGREATDGNGGRRRRCAGERRDDGSPGGRGRPGRGGRRDRARRRPLGAAGVSGRGGGPVRTRRAGGEGARGAAAAVPRWRARAPPVARKPRPGGGGEGGRAHGWRGGAGRGPLGQPTPPALDLAQIGMINAARHQFRNVPLFGRRLVTDSRLTHSSMSRVRASQWDGNIVRQTNETRECP